MLVDDITIKIKAGDGGTGAVAFQKNMKSLGPTGAKGGEGGSIYIEGVSDLSALNSLRFQKEFKADDGRDGRGQFRDGHTGVDLTIKVPVGTVIHDLTTKHDSEITKVGQKILVAHGGQGGMGNFHFRSSLNTSPKQFQSGKPGDATKLRLELKLIADVGFIGLPNVGKSSLLNELTNAKSHVANYPFTTLEPNLGVFYDLILADIPGLIEGASTGKGLGIKFLRHVERTRVLFHIIGADSADPVKDYKTIRQELGQYNKELLDKDEYIFLNKSDAITPDELKKKIAKLKKLNGHLLVTSIHDYESLQKIKKILTKLAKDK